MTPDYKPDLFARANSMVKFLREFGGSSPKETANLLTDLIVALAAKRVKVKPLVWEPGDGEERSECCFRADDGFGGYYNMIEAQWRHSHLGENGFDETDDLAKAAAQADYDIRILAAIEDAP